MMDEPDRPMPPWLTVFHNIPPVEGKMANISFTPKDGR